MTWRGKVGVGKLSVQKCVCVWKRFDVFDTEYFICLIDEAKIVCRLSA